MTDAEKRVVHEAANLLREAFRKPREEVERACGRARKLLRTLAPVDAEGRLL